VTEEEDEEDPAPHEEDRGARLNGLEGRRVAGHACREGFPGPQPRRHHPDDEPGEYAAHDEDGDEDPPGEKPPASPGLHSLQDLGVDDGVVDAGDRLEEGKAQDNEDCGGDIHGRLTPRASGAARTRSAPTAGS